MRLFNSILIISFSVFTACAPQHIEPKKTQLEMREIQTRSYSNKDPLLAMKAVINALQDEGFIIRNADKDLGFINASKETDVSDTGEQIFATIFSGDRARFKKNSVLEASANVTNLNKEVRIRLIFQVKILDNFGAPMSVYQIEEPPYYQDFFAKIDKSLFLERELR